MSNFLNAFTGYAPFGWEAVNLSAGTYTPNTVKPYNNKAFSFWVRAFYQRATSAIELTVPEDWKGAVKDFLYWCLFRRGFVFVGNLPEYDTICQPCNINEFDLYYQPLKAIIANPYMRLEKNEFLLGVEGDLLKLTPDYIGVFDCIFYYAEKMALMDPAINMAINNSKLAWVWAAADKGSAQTIKAVMDEINSGNPAVVFDKLFTRDENGNALYEFIDRSSVANSYIVDKLLQDAQSIINAFDAEIGIPTVPYQKKERMVTSEAQSRTLDSSARATVWVECLNSSIDKIKQVVPGFEMSAKLRYETAAPEEGEEVGTNENDDAGI